MLDFKIKLLTASFAGILVFSNINATAENKGIVPASQLCRDYNEPAPAPRRRPGEAVDEYKLPPCVETSGISPYWKQVELGPPVPDRWRIVETIGITTNLWDPYGPHNPLKGDMPVYGDDWFFNLIAISDTTIEPRRFPIPVGVATSDKAGQLDTIGRGKTTIFAQNIILENVWYKGDTTFRPPDWEFRFTPVLNYNRVTAEEKGVLNIDPTANDDGSKKRTDSFIGLQAAFVDYHIRNVSDRYDFDSVRVGIQPFSSDFRGFLFQDSQLGVRLFGIRDNNKFQYNLAWFRRFEKDTNSGLNDVTQAIRDDDVFIANVYWQDFPMIGFFSQATVIHNRNRELDKNGTEFDKNDFIARPASIFEERLYDYDVTYFGYSGDGHFDRFNLTTSLYFASGEKTSTRFRSSEEEIEAWFFAAEGSLDLDWFRPRVSFIYASGDDDPFDNKAKGFDAIFENPQIAGSDTSFFIRQNVPLIGGGGVALSGRNGILPSLRSSKEQGQSNFINPGLVMLGIGADADILPELRVSLNVNQIWFDTTEVLERVRQQAPIDEDFGLDVSVAVIWRPLMSQNIVFRLSAAAIIPGDGFDDLYGNEADTPYSVLANIVFQY